MQAQGSIRKQTSTIGTGYISAVFRIYDIPSISFSKLISTPFNIANNQFTVITLAIDTSTKAMIGSAGSFKSCHPALICSPLGGGSMLTLPHPATLSAAQLVAKRVFFRRGQGKGRHRFSREDELAKTLDEANCLYWGAALMGMAYTFVDEMLKTGKGSQLPVQPLYSEPEARVN
ncbi:hypothetical protein AZE42_11744 [Rhizopogon vesiculosus]|uniref:Uncharacterized protein n=1 Tax=Rhizopogon vesiculosus TaxID=180088 RepID=A0A1J8QKJ3_9AGAM|nr:hypothetical protein AZE42_11744 [Rhizopogon vesiculosus]